MSSEQRELLSTGQLDTPDTSTFSPEFTERFTSALCEPPILGVFYDSGWDPTFVKRIEEVNVVCEQREICGHGMDHIARTAQNAFVLGDLVQGHFSKVQPANQSMWGEVFSDPSILLPILAHDLGYASENTLWDELHGTNHTQESVAFLDSYFARAPESAIQKQADVFRQAVEGDAQQADVITPQNAFPVVIQAADKLDYFHSDRVTKIQRPSCFEENPYYFLADCVATYELSVDNGKLKYLVQLKDGYGISTSDGTKALDFTYWSQLVKEHYPQVLELAQSVAAMCDTEFVVAPFFRYPPERAAELDRLLAQRNAELREVVAPQERKILPFEEALARRNEALREILES